MDAEGHADSPIAAIALPTRDGTILRGLHYRSTEAVAPLVLTLTPYGAQRHHSEGRAFAARGFNFVSLDVRGRGDSDGTFTPFVDEGRDGHDAVEALAASDWCDGNVVTWGLSYCGFLQWAIAATAPPHLRAMAPVAPVYPGLDFPMLNNVPTTYMLRWLVAQSGRRHNDDLAMDEGFWDEAICDQIASGRPFRDLDLVALGGRYPTFEKWLDHPELDDFWAALVPSAADYAAIGIPVLTITGHYDGNQPGALRYHRDHRSAVGAAVADGHSLVIGPWNHRGTRTPIRAFGGLRFGEGAVIDIISLHAEWYEWALGRGDKPPFLSAPVRFYHEGADEWRSADVVPGERGETARLHLGPRCTLDAAPPLEPASASLRADPTRAASPARRQLPPATLFTDSTAIDASDGDRLLFVGECLTEPLELSGRPCVELRLESELPDFDLLVGLFELAAEAPIEPALLGESPVRARYRESLQRPSAWPRGVPTSIRVELPFLSRRIEAGKRIGLQIGLPHRFWQVNFQAGKVAAMETLGDAVSGEIVLHAAATLGSSLELPLG